MSLLDIALTRFAPAAPSRSDVAPVVGVRAWARRVMAPVLFGAAMLMAVTALAGRPMVFTDTDDYFSQGRDVVKALDLWLTKGVPPIKPDDIGDRLHDPGDQDEEPVHNQNGARSVYYGLFVYTLEQFGSLWAVAAAQAVLAAGIVYALWRTVASGARVQSYLQVMAALTLGSSLPIFTGFAMPDLFAGFAAVATVLWTLYADRLGRWGGLAVWGLLAASMNFHGSDLLTSLALGVLALGWLKWRAAASWPTVATRFGAMLMAALAAILAAKAYGIGVKLRSGDELGRPPFLMARVLADGPGRAYLRRSCATGAKWTLCAYKADPLDKTEDILWSDDPATGIFNSADYHTRLKLEREEHAFVLGAVASDPLGEAGAMLANWGRQLVSVSYADALRDPGYYLSDDYWKTTTLKGLLLRSKSCDPETGGCILHLPADFLSELDAAFAVAALAWMGWVLASEAFPPDGGRAGMGASARRLWRIIGGGAASRAARLGGDGLTSYPPLPPSRGKGSVADERTRAAVVLLVVAVALNAAVCGMLSGPFDRYEARLLWLVPCAALLLDVARRRRT